MVVIVVVVVGVVVVVVVVVVGAGVAAEDEWRWVMRWRRLGRRMPLKGRVWKSTGDMAGTL